MSRIQETFTRLAAEGRTALMPYVTTGYPALDSALEVVPALVEAMDGVAVPPLLQAELELVTAENVRELFPDTPSCDT